MNISVKNVVPVRKVLAMLTVHMLDILVLMLIIPIFLLIIIVENVLQETKPAVIEENT